MKINWNWILIVALIVSSCEQKTSDEVNTQLELTENSEAGNFYIQVADLEEARNFYT
jgi:hypothetical protein